MSLRIDTTDLISGALVIGDTGHGVLGSDIPSVGDSGPSYLYNDLSLPADADKEIRGLVTTPPSAGTFFAYEDGSFSYDGPSGSFAYQLYVDGVATGSPVTVTLTSGEITGTSSTAQGSNAVSATGTIALTGTASITQAGNAVAAEGTLVSGISGSASIQQSGNSVYSTGTIAITGYSSINQGAHSLSATGQVPIIGTLASQLEDAIVVATGINGSIVDVKYHVLTYACGQTVLTSAIMTG